MPTRFQKTAGLPVVMVIDDQTANVQVVGQLLTQSDYDVVPALDGREALAIAERSPPDLVLLDMRMPGLDGFQVLLGLQAMPQTRDVPVVFLTADHERDSLTRAFSAGAVDYITKPFLAEELLARVRTHLDLKQAQTLLNLPGGVSVIETTVAQIFQADQIAQRLGRLTGLQAESWMTSNGQLLNALASQSMTTQMIRIFVGISVAFGIASVLAVSVVQRTREIGILRAMGSPRGQILRVFLLQGGLLGLFGSLAGSGIGWGLVQLFNLLGPKLFIIPVPADLIPLAILIATLTGILAAAMPARRAARYDPAVAIRYV